MTVVPFKSQQEQDEDALVEKYIEVDHIVNGYINAFQEMFDQYEIGADDELFAKDFAYFIEAFRSIIYRDYELEHPFHPHVENAFDCAINDMGEWEIKWVLPEDEEGEEDNE